MNLWTGIIGVKGRMMLGAGDWFINYYADVGSGYSTTTWQGIGGVGYAFKWGEVILDYRTLHYNVGGQKLIDELTAKARITVDDAARADIYKQVQQQIWAESHDILLWFRNGTIGAQPAVMGLDTVVHPNGSNLNFHKVWLKA